MLPLVEAAVMQLNQELSALLASALAQQQ